MLALEQMTTFREELERWLEEHGETPFSFGRKLGHASNSTVREVLLGKTPVPLNDLANWLAKMHLSETERERLYRMALRDCAPRWALEIIGRCDELRAELDRVHAALSRHGLTLDELERLEPEGGRARGERPGRRPGGEHR
jgi:hypothetical protein